MNIFNSKESVKINIPKVLYETLKESADSHDMTVSDYINYLVYKENYFYLSNNSLQKEKPLIKFYDKYNGEKAEKDLWTNIFNLE